MPYPVGRGLFIWGSPIWVVPGSTNRELEAKRVQLEEALNTMTADADEVCSD